VAESNKQVFRVVIAGSQEAIFKELTATDRPLGTKTEKEMRGGGPFILDNLKAIVEKGRPPFMTRLMYAAFGALEFVLPRRTKSEHWPLDGSGKEKP
jgi:hypothetical protein